VTEQQLNGAQICAGLKQVDGKGVAQGVGCDWFGDIGLAPRLPAGVLYCERRDRLSG